MSVQIHPSAQIESDQIGADVSIGPLSVVRSGAVLRRGCKLGAGVCIGTSAIVGPGAELGDAVVLASAVEVGAGACVEAGAVVTRAVPAFAIVQGPGATIVGYVTTSVALHDRTHPLEVGVVASKVRGVQLHVMPEVRDMRGDLCVAEVGRDVPFEVKRSFLVYNVPNAEIRGEHAHRQCAQYLMAVRGSVHVVADDGKAREEFRLDRPNIGLYLPAMTWGIQYRYSEDGALLVLASHHYDPSDYIRNYDEFISLSRLECRRGT